MRRIHLFELEDFDWVPRPIRDGGTDLLDLAFDKLGFYAGVAPKLVALIQATGASRVVDLCSGGGGGTLAMRRSVRAAGLDVDIVLTDRNPNEAGIARVQASGDARTTYLAEPVDAMTGGGSQPGVRTMS
ncbi:MAG: class I SAM-dependent methyltransferase, partial [Myxococcota bacterium]